MTAWRCDSLHHGRQHAYASSPVCTTLQVNTTTMIQADRGGERLQQQRRGERDLHHHIANGGDADVQSCARHLHGRSICDAIGHDNRGGDSLHNGWKHADREFAGVHDIAGKHDHHNQGDRRGERLQQQRGGERDLHDHIANGGDADVQPCARHLQLGSICNAIGHDDRSRDSLHDRWKHADGEFAGVHHVAGEHDHHDQGDRRGEWIQQQRRGERDLHHQHDRFPNVNYGPGFSSTGLALNGFAKLNGTRLRLTDGGATEAGSGFYTTPLNVQSFTTDFSFQLTNPNADGMAFVIQNAGTTALGPMGGGLGYGAPGTGGIPSSVAVKFDLYNNAGEGTNSTGLYTMELRRPFPPQPSAAT